MHAPTMALPGVMFTLREVRSPPKTPTVDEIYEFIKTLFNKAQLSSECSLVCLIYVERLMETAHVPLLAGTWKPVLLCGLLLASKVRFGVCMWLFFFLCLLVDRFCGCCLGYDVAAGGYYWFILGYFLDRQKETTVRSERSCEIFQYTKNLVVLVNRK